jgi:hypothetical protein
MRRVLQNAMLLNINSVILSFFLFIRKMGRYKSNVRIPVSVLALKAVRMRESRGIYKTLHVQGTTETRQRNRAHFLAVTRRGQNYGGIHATPRTSDGSAHCTGRSVGPRSAGVRNKYLRNVGALHQTTRRNNLFSDANPITARGHPWGYHSFGITKRVIKQENKAAPQLRQEISGSGL